MSVTEQLSVLCRYQKSIR